ncbi:MAG: hypothetical protein CMO01_01310 [Thalassobius sp.]|nr:hypothetical protein [Thalassovita sp.]
MKTYQYLRLKELISLLKANHFQISISTYLDIKKILEYYDNSKSPEDIKTLLCPLIAKNPQEQEQFYKIFNDCFKERETIIKASVFDDVEIDQTTNQLVPSTKLLSAVALVLIFIISGIFWLKKDYWQQDVLFKKSVKQNSEIRFLKQKTIPELDIKRQIKSYEIE